MGTAVGWMRHVGKNLGIAAVMAVVCLTLLLGVAALAVDTGDTAAAKSDLQNAADAAALAGAGYIGMRYVGLSYDEQQLVTITRQEVVNVVQAVARSHSPAGVALTISDSAEDIVIGRLKWAVEALTWRADAEGRPIIDPTHVMPDAVRVTVRRDADADNPVSTFFAGVFGRKSVPTAAEATAALTGPATVGEGELKAPFSLSENNFPNDCTEEIRLSPVTEPCAGWHNFFKLPGDPPVSANALARKMFSLIAGDGDGIDGNDCLLAPCGRAWLDDYFEMNPMPEPARTPETAVNDGFNHMGDDVAPLFRGGILERDENGDITGAVLGDPKYPAPFPALFDYFRYRDGDEDDTVWTTTVPVYSEAGECVNPIGIVPITGFAAIEIRMPNPPPDTSVSVCVRCEPTVVEGRGEGGIFGNLRGTIPNLIE